MCDELESLEIIIAMSIAFVFCLLVIFVLLYEANVYRVGDGDDDGSAQSSDIPTFRRKRIRNDFFQNKTRIDDCNSKGNLASDASTSRTTASPATSQRSSVSISRSLSSPMGWRAWSSQGDVDQMDIALGV
mmetsp:Transcript_55669/g.120258  ORF Transcript_55669/g.120258 Transcript_55669/m.120258 type:complete len:131 (-) Transcript_55669:111-503(-)